MSTQTQKAPSYHITLTPTLSQFVDQLVESGLYGNTSEVMREALREKYQKAISDAKKLAELKKLIQEGIDDIESGNIGSRTIDDILKDIE